MPRVVGLPGALQSGDVVGRVRNALGVQAEVGGHLRHIHVLGPHHLVRERVVALAPEAGAVSGEPPVADVDHGDAHFLAHRHLQVAQHVAHTRVSGHRDAVAVGEGQPCRHGTGQTEAQCRNVAPAQEPARYQRVVYRAQLVAGVPRIVRHERVHGVQRLHHVAEHAVGVDRLVVRRHELPVLGHSGVPRCLDRRGHVVAVAYPAARALGHPVGQRPQREPGIAHNGVVGGEDTVEVEFVQVTLDDGLVGSVGYAVGEAPRREAGPYGQDHVALFQELGRGFASYADE